MNIRNIFTRTNQPIALEVRGWVVVLLTAFMIVMVDYHDWRSYVYAIIAAVFIGTLYRMNIAYPERVQDGLCKLAGKTPTTLTEQEKIRYSVLGLSLFIPPIVSFFTFPYLLQTSFNAPIVLSYILTIPLATLIFIVDRSFVVTMGWKKIWYAVLIRLTLATVLGMFLSKPIELQIFHQETTEELKVQKTEKLAKIEKDRAAAHAAINAREAEAMKELNRARTEYETEVNSSIGGRRPGHGIEAKKKLEYFEQQEALFRTEVAPLLAADRARTDSLFNAQAIEYEQTQSYGFGARSAALDAAAKKYPAVMFTSWLIMLTLILLDISPLLAKLLMPKSDSDRAEQIADEAAEQKIKISKIDYKYQLMKRELEKTLTIIDTYSVSEEERERMRQVTRDKLSRRYFGDEIFSMN